MPLRKIVFPWESIPSRDQAWYDEQCERMTEDQVARDIDRNYAKSVSGKVFSSFNERFHHSEKRILVNRDSKVYRIWDFGGVNGCLFIQMDSFFRVRALHEVVLGELKKASSTPEQIERVLADSVRLFRDCEFYDICDPAGQNTVYQGADPDVIQLNNHRIWPQLERILAIPTPRRKPYAMSMLTYDLQKFAGGQPSFMLYCNPEKTEGCPVLLSALQGGYRYKKDAAGNFRDEIHEVHPFEDVMDPLFYFYLQVKSVDEQDYKEHKPLMPGGTVDPYTGYRM